MVAVLVCGAGLVVTTLGLAMIYQPAGLIFAGLGLATAGAFLVNVDKK